MSGIGTNEELSAENIQRKIYFWHKNENKITGIYLFSFLMPNVKIVLKNMITSIVCL